MCCKGGKKGIVKKKEHTFYRLCSIQFLSVPQIIGNWQDIELGTHGVIIKKGIQSGVFLPQVATETGWSKEEFLSQLCFQKAGLPPDCYKEGSGVELLTFKAQVFSESGKE